MHIGNRWIEMKCSDLKKYILENGIEEIAGTCLDDHRKACKQCCDFISELVSVSAMVRSLDRKPAPVGFDDRLRARIAAEKAADRQHGLSYQINQITSAFLNVMKRRYALAPIFAALVVFAILLSTNIIPLNHTDSMYGSDVTDWAYIRACKNAHVSISAKDPFVDRSAQLLRSSAIDADQGL